MKKLLASIIFLAFATSCNSSPTKNEKGITNNNWSRDGISVHVLDKEKQNFARIKLSSKSFISLSSEELNELNTKPDGNNSYYYLSKAKYYGTNIDLNNAARETDLSAHINSDGIVYIETFQLTKIKTYSYFYVIINSSRPINEVIVNAASAE